MLEFEAIQNPDVVSGIGDFSGIAFGTTYVSFDPNAIPKLSSVVSAVLPASRSVQVGTPATFFAVMINASDTDATGCRVSPSIGPLGQFDFFRTEAATNAVIGEANTTFDIPAGATQTLVLSVTPGMEIPSTDVPIDYRCDSSEPATSIVGVNTLLLSASNSPVADVVGLTTVVDLVAPQGETTLFAVASVNVGASDIITVSLDTGNAPLPVNLLLCETDPIENNPNAHRIFIRFRDSAGEVRGATTSAVRTQ